MENDKSTFTLGDNFGFSGSIDDLEIITQQLPSYVILAKVEDIPKNLKRFRGYRKLTLREVEQKTGISNGYLSQLEDGKTSNPSFDKVVKLCKAYNVRLVIN